MKKLFVFVVMAVFFSVAATAQSEQKPAKAKAKKETVGKAEVKTEAAAKSEAKAGCSAGTEGKSCCSKEGSKAENAEPKKEEKK